MNRRVLCVFGLVAAVIGGCGRGMKKVDLTTAPLEARAGVSSVDADSVVSVPITISVRNPGKQPLTLLSSAWALNSGGVLLAQGREDLRVKNVPPKVAPGASLEVPVAAKVSSAAALKALGADRGGESVPYEAQVYLMVDSPTTGPITLSQSAAGTLALPPTLEGSLLGAIFNDRATGGKHYVKFALRNRNPWPIEMQGIDVEFTLGSRVGTAHAKAEARLAVGGLLELLPAVEFNPPLGASDAPAPGTKPVLRVRGTATGQGPVGTLVIPFAFEGPVEVFP